MTGEVEKIFNPSIGILLGHPYTDGCAMRRGILRMCQGMRLGGELSEVPISEEGFLETRELGSGLSKSLKIFFPKR